MASAEIVVREVWESNLEEEINLIQARLEEFPYISMDTEFPGTVYKSIPNPSSSELYAVMKSNVDAMHLIQLGLTLSDAAGNMPLYGGIRYVWEFNFADFDLESDPHDPESISLLQRQGINLAKNRRLGIHARNFALYFKMSGLALRSIRPGDLKWVTFHGLYDLGFMIKILTRAPLPDSLAGFMELVGLFFGPVVYDLKRVAQAAGLLGGLERIATTLMVERAVGRSHQAGSDSLLTMRVLVELIKAIGEHNLQKKFKFSLFGLNQLAIV